MNPFKSFKIYHLLFGLIAGFMLVLLSVVIWFSYTTSSKEFVQNTFYYQQQLLSELNKQLSIQLVGIEQTALATSQNVRLEEFASSNRTNYQMYRKKKDIEWYLAQITYSSTVIDSIDLYISYDVGPYSGTQDFGVRLLEHTQLLNEPWYADIELSDDAWLGERTLLTSRGSRNVLSYVRKLYSNLGQYQGVIVIHVKAPAIHQLIAGRGGNESTIRHLFDSGGRPMLQRDQSGKLEALSSFVSETKSPSGYRVAQQVNGAWVEGSEYLMVWSEDYSTKWKMIELTPYKEITRGSLNLALALTLIGLCALIAVLFVTHYIARQFTLPIRHLLSAMGKFSVDRKPVKLPGDYNNEFGAMFNGFRSTSDKIIQLYDSLEEQHRRQRDAEISALQANINPHFLYNTLDQLNWMAIDAGEEQMSRVLELMGRMFRIGLSNGERWIRIEDELEHLACYLEIQQIRWGEGLEYEIEVDEGCRKAWIPKLTLQPFVENAVLHGLHGRMSGRIRIRCLGDASRLEFTIEDDGVGIPENGVLPPSRKKGGYGVKNVRERLDAYFGAPYGVTIKPRPEGGTAVVVAIPRIENIDDQLGGGRYVENRTDR
ncbi:cache domain-containing sensor histidine kinase [Paenibacillus abyssi]|uniref:Histidine kinase n=1 Tax=Paenibacillus abyssi TaxID=1340531 RepID=A0A917FUT5_9BACL|nr:sensor histidine kinase [Paenibacillus abyssi]GGG02808.1 histidine kinase [Paenibacillus abyssi]